MKNKKSIEEQVAELTLEQQDKIIKVGKVATALQLVGGIPWFLLCLMGLWVIINPPLSMSWSDYDKLYLGFLTLLVIGAVYVLGIFLFVKIKYPYYSDTKWRYIAKKRKADKR